MQSTEACAVEADNLTNCLSDGSAECMICSETAFKDNDGTFPANDIGQALRCDGLKKSSFCADLIECASKAKCTDSCLSELYAHSSCIVKSETGSCDLNCSSGFKSMPTFVVAVGVAVFGWLQL